MLATARSGTVDVCPKAIPTTNKQGVRAFIDRGEGGNRGEGLEASVVVGDGVLWMNIGAVYKFPQTQETAFGKSETRHIVPRVPRKSTPGSFLSTFSQKCA